MAAHAISRIWRAGLDLWFPPQCLACGCPLDGDASGLSICATCEHHLAPMPVARCPRCAAAAPYAAHPTPGCAHCRGAPLRFEAAFALADYDGPLRAAVLHMKRWRNTSLAMVLGHLMARQLKSGVAAWRPDVIVPVPMHWRRLWHRGINSPAVLAECLGRGLGVTVAAHSLVRRKATRPQGALRPRERWANVRRAFRLRQPEDFRGARVLLIDDILTTGATCNQAARVLLRARAAAVAVAVAARAGGK